MLGEAATAKANESKSQRLRIKIRGAVQGVGFRPFMYRLATQLELFGSVNNSPDGVTVEVEGPTDKLHSFLMRLSEEKPPRSFIQSLESSWLDAAGHSEFVIGESENDGEKAAIVLPDIATCPDCFADTLDPENRRYRYPFTNCTNCGPRYSIIRSIPYDRANTTMAAFEMCGACREEYEDPLDRRFHAQPNACDECGPKLTLCDANGTVLCDRNDALVTIADAIRDGSIVAVKGLGGFHLMADARNDDAVRELRRRKQREEKPLAVMFPSVEAVEQVCDLDTIEQRLLTSPESPLVLLKRRGDTLSPSLASGNPYLGAMLPYTPLHHLLMRELSVPIVATSGNLSDEPICIDNTEALARLNGIADFFLVHDRPIERHVDDSIVRVVAGREMVIRRARGFAPLPVTVVEDMPPTLAVGGHLKNSVAISTGDDVFISQHIGDLETGEALGAFERVIHSLETLYDVAPAAIACDKHPDYASSRWAMRNSLNAITVQHHYAHVLSCMAENEIAAPCLGIAWDGTGYGDDGTIWGGEFLRIDESGYERIAHFRHFRLPGGDIAAKEPRRSALGLLYAVYGEAIFDSDLPTISAFDPQELGILRSMLWRNVNTPVTSSAGRLFDAVASIIDLRQIAHFEGQAAMELEFAADLDVDAHYEFELNKGAYGPMIIDWEPMIRSIIDDYRAAVATGLVAAKFHNTLVEMMVAVAQACGEETVALSGGCFQNKYLLERAIARLRNEAFCVYRHQRVPTNDGGISLGQIAAAARENSKYRRTIRACA